jgi:23S rRNA maturation-related 3'-5' exoribonuclease YhaM
MNRRFEDPNALNLEAPPNLPVPEITSKLPGQIDLLPEIKAIIEKKPFILDVLKEVYEFDHVTFEHLLKTGGLAVFISKELNLPASKSELLLSSALVHDVGKIFVPKEIVQKPGKFSPEELAMMQEHVWKGFAHLIGLNAYEEAEMEVRHHQHKGYPREQCEENIQMSKDIRKAERREENPEIEELSRTLSILDIFDATKIGGNRLYNIAGKAQKSRGIELKIFNSDLEKKVIELLYKKEASVLNQNSASSL